MEIETLAEVNIGRTADLLLSNISPILDHYRGETIAMMKQSFRGKTMDQTEMNILMARLCSIDDLESRLKTEILKGRKAYERINK